MAARKVNAASSARKSFIPYITITSRPAGAIPTSSDSMTVPSIASQCFQRAGSLFELTSSVILHGKCHFNNGQRGAGDKAKGHPAKSKRLHDVM